MANNNINFTTDNYFGFSINTTFTSNVNINLTQSTK